jgi:hypothetical protein
MVSWCLDLDERRDRDECTKPIIGRARNLSNGNVAVFSLVRFQEKEVRKALQGNNRAGSGVRKLIVSVKRMIE